MVALAINAHARLSLTAVEALAASLRAASRRPLTAAMVLALAVTATRMAGAGSAAGQAMVLQASTNVANMLTHPVRVLLASAFWGTSPALFWPLAGLVVLVLGAGERCLGAARTALLFAVGHVGATLVTVTAIAAGVAHDWVPASAATATDVGPSYGLAAVAAGVLARESAARRHRAALPALVAGLALLLVMDRTFTDAGHLIAALLGLLLAYACPELLPSPSSDGPLARTGERRDHAADRAPRLLPSHRTGRLREIRGRRRTASATATPAAPGGGR